MKANKSVAITKLLVLALALAALLSQLSLASGATVSPSQCRTERQNGVDNCKMAFFGQAPSAACCRIVKTGHVECACPAIDPKLAALLTVKRIVSIFNTCGRAVPHNFQCGSLYFP